jgi:beta-glucosidase
MVGAIPANPQALFTRTDATVDFHWWEKAPRADMHEDDFGVRWIGFLAPTVAPTPSA